MKIIKYFEQKRFVVYAPVSSLETDRLVLDDLIARQKEDNYKQTQSIRYGADLHIVFEKEIF